MSGLTTGLFVFSDFLNVEKSWRRWRDAFVNEAFLMPVPGCKDAVVAKAFSPLAPGQAAVETRRYAAANNALGALLLKYTTGDPQRVVRGAVLDRANPEVRNGYSGWEALKAAAVTSTPQRVNLYERTFAALKYEGDYSGIRPYLLWLEDLVEDM
eukprot:8186842-Prorocentrum_lima.AAC.1